MIYLASPYTDSNEMVMEQRFEAACKQTALLIGAGIWVWSPIVHGHPLTAYGLPHTYEFWQGYNGRSIEWCKELWVLMLVGFEGSVGIRRELVGAVQLGKPVRFIRPGETLAHYDAAAVARLMKPVRASA